MGGWMDVNGEQSQEGPLGPLGMVTGLGGLGSGRRRRGWPSWVRARVEDPASGAPGFSDSLAPSPPAPLPRLPVWGPRGQPASWAQAGGRRFHRLGGSSTLRCGTDNVPSALAALRTELHSQPPARETTSPGSVCTQRGSGSCGDTPEWRVTTRPGDTTSPRDRARAEGGAEGPGTVAPLARPLASGAPTGRAGAPGADTRAGRPPPRGLGAACREPPPPDTGLLHPGARLVCVWGAVVRLTLFKERILQGLEDSLWAFFTLWRTDAPEKKKRGPFSP